MNPSKAKGTRFETLVCDYLRDHGHPYAERRALRGVRDCGDIAGIPGVVIECKAAAAHNLAGWLDEVRAEVLNAAARYGVAVVKRKARPVADAYVVMTLATFAELTGDTGP